MVYSSVSIESRTEMAWSYWDSPLHFITISGISVKVRFHKNVILIDFIILSRVRGKHAAVAWTIIMISLYWVPAESRQFLNFVRIFFSILIKKILEKLWLVNKHSCIIKNVLKAVISHNSKEHANCNSHIASLLISLMQSAKVTFFINPFLNFANFFVRKLH